tara:strand:+ start:431 stop:604 length:174 start_codon:yes stop_codon:yes gene_type:complete
LAWRKEDEAKEKKRLEEEKKEFKEGKAHADGNGGEWALKMPKDIVEGGSGKYSSAAR